jgi:hypothetical protein
MRWELRLILVPEWCMVGQENFKTENFRSGHFYQMKMLSV